MTRQTSVSLFVRLGPPINMLDEVRSRHRRQEVATPDDHVDVTCATCYIFDEPWPCAVARLIAVVDEQIEAEVATPNGAHEPGDDHHYRIECDICGQRGMFNLTVEPQTAALREGAET